MATNALIRYGKNFLFLFGIVQSFADPITDILTLVEFYRTDHKTWFRVGLCFVILPCTFFTFIHLAHGGQNSCRGWGSYVFTLSCIVMNPLFAAFIKLKEIFVYLTRDPNRIPHPAFGDDSLCKIAVIIEATLESAPQFIIQLYAVAVQQKSVTIVQMISLPVSFLSLAWASIVADELIHSDEGALHFSWKDKVLLYVTHFFILSSRLFALALFTVKYKWWVASVLIFHCMVVVVFDTVWLSKRGRHFESRAVVYPVLLFCFHWLRDDLSLTIHLSEAETRNNQLRIMLLFSNVLFVMENITMILLFYFSHFPHTWYSLPVTICVCLFAVLGAGMRLTHSYFLTKESDDDVYV